MFAITMNIDSLNLITDIARYFGCGNITVSKQSVTFRVTNFFHIWHIIIPHFLKYPLSGRKLQVFKLFTLCCSLMLPFHHKTLPFPIVFKIIYLSFLMNEGSKRNLENFQSLLISILEKAKIDNKKEELVTYSKLIDSLNNKRSIISINNFLPEEAFNVDLEKFSSIIPNNYIDLNLYSWNF